MPINSEKFWVQMASGLRRYLGFEPLATSAEAESQPDGVDEMPLSDDEIERVVSRACAGKRSGRDASLLTEWAIELDTSAIDADMAVINRNAGEKDVQTNNLLRQLRKRALEERRANRKHKDSNGMAGRDQPPDESG